MASAVAAHEKAKLQKALRCVDLVLFTACAIITIDYADARRLAP
jgi:hypothetical protein